MHRSLIFIVISTLIVMSLTVASYFVLTEFKPEREIRQMLLAMSELDSFSQKGGVSWTRTNNATRAITTLYTTGNIDLQKPDSIDHQTSFRVVNVRQGKEYTDLSGEIRRVDGKTYLTYQPPGPTVSGVDFQAEETWVSFEEGEFSAWGTLIPGLETPLDLRLTPSPWSPEGMARLRSLLSVADVFTVSYDDVTERIDGANTRIIDARFDPGALRAFFYGLIRAKEGREPNDEERIAAEMRARQLERLTLRLWIGVADHLLYRIQAAGAFVEGKSTQLIPVDVRFDLSNFNAITEIPLPKSTLEFSELIRATLSTSLFGDPNALPSKTFVTKDSAHLQVQKIETSNDKDEDGLDALMEVFYGTNPNNPDTDGDGISDGDEVAKNRNPRGKGTLFGFGLD